MTLKTFKIDPIARDIALRRSVLPECLHVPIAAVDGEAIAIYIGDIVRTLARGVPGKAFLVRAKPPAPIDDRFANLGEDGSRRSSSSNAGLGPCRLHPLPERL